MAEFAIATAASIALSLAVSLLTAPNYKEDRRDRAILKSGYGFEIEKPFGKVRLRSRNVIWGLPIRDEEEDSGKGNRPQQTTSYATFAVMGGWGEIKRVHRIWFGNELIYNGDPIASQKTQEEAAKFRAEHLEIYYGTNTQMPSPTIEEREGVGNVNAYRNRFYLVFKDIEVNAGSGYPTVDIEVVESDDSPLDRILTWACTDAAGLENSQVQIDSTLNSYQNVNFVIPQDGSAISDSIEQLQKIYFFFSIDTGDAIIFRDYDTPKTLPEVELTLNDLACVPDNSQVIDRYNRILPDRLDLPSEIQIEYPSPARDYDLGLQTAYRHDALHQNQTNIRTEVLLSDERALNVAWRTLSLLYLQSNRIEQLRLLPSKGDSIVPGNLIKIPIDSILTAFQVDKKEIGDNDLIEISAVPYEEIIPNFTATSFAVINQDVSGIPFGQAIAIDIPLIEDGDADLGLYVGVTSEEKWQFGSIYYSEDNGNSYNKLTDFTGRVILGKVTQLPSVHDSSTIDYGSRIAVTLETYGKTLESLDYSAFLNEKNLGLFGNEIISWQNAQLVAPNTYHLTTLLRGLRGTEWAISQHSLNERFIVLKDLKRISGNVAQIGKTFLFKAAHSGQSLDEITTPTSLTVTGESIKPYSPVNLEVIPQSNQDLLISWNLRTRRYGVWREGVEVTLSDTNQSTLEILDNSNNVIRTEEIFSDNPSYLYTLALQVADFGTPQTSLNLRVYQINNLIGRGNFAQAYVS